MEQAPIKIGQYVLGKNLGIGAFGKVSFGSIFDVLSCKVGQDTGQFELPMLWMMD